jgi:hypothetical protein
MRSESTALFTTDDVEMLRRTLGQARSRFLSWRRRRLGLRGGLLYLAGSPLLLAVPVALVTGNLVDAVAAALAFGLVVVAARLNRRGMLERLLAPERRYTRATRLPLQFLALVPLVAAVLLTAGVVVGHAWPLSLAFAALAAVGFVLAYRPGFPVRGVGTAKIDDPALLRALQQAERQLLSIEAVAMNIGNAELEQRLRRIVDRARTVLAMLEQRPADLFRARQFLQVHLDGAERVAVRYARTHPIARGGQLEDSFGTVLTHIEQAIEKQRQQLLRKDAFDLDVQITVLKRQLAQQGIH